MCLYIKYVTQCKITEVYHDLLVLYQDHLPWMHQDLKIVGTCSHSKLKFFWRKKVVFLVWKLCPGENYFYTIFLSHALAKTRLTSVHESIYIMELQCTFPMVLSVVLFILQQCLVFFFFLTITHIDMMLQCDLLHTILYSMWYFLFCFINKIFYCNPSF